MQSDALDSDPIVQPRRPLNPHLIPLSELLQNNNIPLVLWGENALREHHIPAAVLRDDLIVPSDRLEDAAAILLENGFQVSTGNLPMAHAPFWGEGWDKVAEICRRFYYPASFNVDALELLLYPTTYVGFDREPLDDRNKFSRVSSNIYCPTAHTMAASLARTYINHSESPEINRFRTLLDVWAAYFFEYTGFRADSLDGYAEKEVEEWWRKHSPPHP